MIAPAGAVERATVETAKDSLGIVPVNMPVNSEAVNTPPVRIAVSTEVDPKAYRRDDMRKRRPATHTQRTMEAEHGA